MLCVLIIKCSFRFQIFHPFLSFYFYFLATANDILVNYHSLKSFIFSSLCESMFSFLNLSSSNHPAPPPIEIIPQVCDLQWSAFYLSEIRNSDQVHPLILCFLLLDIAF
ncbi:unnamed protein product [Citrullus colocynthis]|uniref:Uncharacterized protein n=1 Tax=Citrullus colocynthis TaxID=252529 RepID=A0ABP0YI79_9ROSI